MAGEIAERNNAAWPSVALVGVRRGGVPLAARLRALLARAGGREVPVGAVDITLYRDDAATALPDPKIGRSEIPFDVEGPTPWCWSTTCSSPGAPRARPSTR
jgi:pyrimidine operon attenuation protein/uracil phosphoribosyltransferase